MGVLCAIAYHQPIDRAGLKDIFGKEVSRDLLARWRPGAPHAFVTTEIFLTTFDLQSLRDLPELDLAVNGANEKAQTLRDIISGAEAKP